MIIQIIGAFIAILSFSIVIKVPRKYLVYCGLIGAVGWLVYLLSLDVNGIVVSSFISAMSIAIVSHTFARIYKAPVTIFLIPGILTLVPGAGMFHTVYNLFLGDQGKSIDYLLQTLEIAGMIALAIFTTDSFFSLMRRKSKKSPTS